MKNKSLTPQIRFKGYDDEWMESSISEHFTLYSGTTPSRSIPNAFCGSVNWISSGELKPHYIGETKEKITEEVFEKSSLRLLPSGLLVIAIYGLEAAGVRGTASITSVPTTISQACTAFIPKFNGEVETEFLYGWYKHNGNYIGTHFAQGTKQQNLKSEIINELSIAYPKEDEQKQIGSLLKNIDALIADAERELDRLEKIKKASLQKMFPRPSNTTPEVRFDGFTEPWKEVCLNTLVERITRKNGNQSQLALTISSLLGLVDQETYFNHRVASKDVSNYYLILNGEFAYNKSTSDGFPWGSVKRLDRYDKGVLSTLYIVFRLKSLELVSDFLTVYFDTDLWHGYLSLNAAEGARNHGLLNISSEDFLDLPILFPNKEEQKIISEYFYSLNSIIEYKRKKLEKLQNLKQAYLDKMFINTTAR